MSLPVPLSLPPLLLLVLLLRGRWARQPGVCDQFGRSPCAAGSVEREEYVVTFAAGSVEPRPAGGKCDFKYSGEMFLAGSVEPPPVLDVGRWPVG